MIKHILFLVFFLSLITVRKTDAQNTPFSVELSTQYGSFLPHHKYLNYFITDHLPSFQLNFSKQKTYDQLWINQTKQPQVGYGLYYLDMKNPDVLGKVAAGYAFIDRPYIYTKNSSLLYRAALGVSYATKPFDRLTNYTNVALGSHWNVYLEIGFFAEWNITEKMFLKTGFNFTHFSNGNISEPNFGANIVSFSARLRYNLVDSEKETATSEAAHGFVLDKIAYSVLLSGGVKMRNVKTGTLYPITTFTFSRHRKYGGRKMWTIALDLFYDQSLKQYYADKELKYKNFDLSYYGVHLSHEWCFGRMHFTAQLGGYVYAKWDNYHHYHRLGLRYSLLQNTWLAVSLKTYYAQADFIEWGIAYSWQKTAE